MFLNFWAGSDIKTSFFNFLILANSIFLLPNWLLLGSPMLMDPHPSLQHAGLQHTVWWLQQEVTRPKARFKPTSSKKYGVDGGAIRCQHILVIRFTCTPHFQWLENCCNVLSKISSDECWLYLSEINEKPLSYLVARLMIQHWVGLIQKCFPVYHLGLAIRP